MSRTPRWTRWWGCMTNCGWADGWFLERRHPAEWSRRTEVAVLDHEQAAEADPLVGVHDELRLARLARQKQQDKSV